MVAPIFPAVVRASAYPQVVNASAVGNTPRYTTLSVAVSGALAVCVTSWPLNGRHAAMPTAAPNVVSCRADACRSAGFWQTTAIEYDSAASRHSRIPVVEAPPPPDVAIPTTTTPANDTAMPSSSDRGKPSFSSRPLSRAITTGPMLTTIAAVPASTFCSPQFSATM